MNFKPNNKKLSLSILISLICNILYYWFSELSHPPPFGINYGPFELLMIAITYLFRSLKGVLSLIITFIIVYIIWSLIEKSQRKKK